MCAGRYIKYIQGAGAKFPLYEVAVCLYPFLVSLALKKKKKLWVQVQNNLKGRRISFVQVSSLLACLLRFCGSRRRRASNDPRENRTITRLPCAPPLSINDGGGDGVGGRQGFEGGVRGEDSFLGRLNLKNGAISRGECSSVARSAKAN